MDSIRTAACVAVGTELLGTRSLDRNSLVITDELARRGVRVVEKVIVGDDEQAIAETVRRLARGVDLIVLTGGLGPTADDVTREALATACNRRLVHDAAVEEDIRARFAARGREMPRPSLRLARTVEGGAVLTNPTGTAPGVLIEHEGTAVAAVPGVPHEMRAMVTESLLPALAGRLSDHGIIHRTVLVGGVAESELEERITGLYRRFGRDSITVLCGAGLIRVVLTAEGDHATAQGRLDEMDAALAQVLGPDRAGVDTESLAPVALDLLRRQGSTVTTAESCTGGMVGAMLTAVPGASDVFLGGVVSYSNASKERELGVDRSTLETRGAVSEAVARAMAEGVRHRFESDWGIGITGVAGPGGGTDDKPVGLVHWAVAGSAETRHGSRVFAADREHVRRCAANAALDLLRRSVQFAEGRKS